MTVDERTSRPTPSPMDLVRRLKEGSLRRVSTLPDLVRLVNIECASSDLPVVVISLAPGREVPRLPLDDVEAVIKGRAAALVMGSSRLGYQFGEAHPRLRCSGGAVRTYYPDGRVARAIVIREGDSIEAALDRIDDDLWAWEERRARQGSKRPSSSPSSSSPLSSPVSPMPSSAPRTPDGDDPSEPADPGVDVEALVAELEATRRQLKELRTANRSLERRLEEALDRLHPVVHSDPEEQFRFELGHHFLVSTSEADRQRWPLRSFAIGVDFLSSVNDIGGLATRERIMQVVCDVLTRRAYEMPARRVHLHAPAGGQALVRDGDGATAFRCSVKSESPGAARLLWWELVDGTVELGRVGHHDEYKLR